MRNRPCNRLTSHFDVSPHQVHFTGTLSEFQNILTHSNTGVDLIFQKANLDTMNFNSDTVGIVVLILTLDQI